MKFLRKSRKRLAVIIVIILVLAVAARQLFFKGTPPPQYQTVNLAQGTIVSAITASGTISTANNLPVSTSLGGQISNIYVQNGDKVVAGQKLLDIAVGTSDQQRATAAYASYQSAQNSLNTANQNKLSLQQAVNSAQSKLLSAQISAVPYANWDPTDKTKQMIDDNVRSAELSYQLAEQQYANADAQIAQAQTSLASASLSYQASQPTITAPISGSVSDMSVVVGSVIGQASSGSSSAGSNASGGSTASSSKLMTIKVDGNTTASVTISEIDINKINENQKVTLTLDALPDKTFTGKVISIDRTGSVASSVTSYPVLIQFDTNPDGVLPNMSVNASIIVNSKDNVLTVPTGAIHTTGTTHTVNVLRDGQSVSVDVQTGISSDINTEITSGLTTSDVVITGTVTAVNSTGGSIFSGGIRLGGGSALGGSAITGGGGGARTGGGTTTRSTSGN